MKKKYLIILIICLSISIEWLKAQTLPAELTGVWKYELNGEEGMAIISPTHAAWIIMKNDRQNLNNRKLTTEDKIIAFDAISNIAVTTIAIDKNKRCTNKYIYSHDPANIGQHFSWDYEIKGDLFTYWIIQADGGRGTSGKARRLAAWNAKSDFSPLNGLWNYSGMYNGYYFHSGNYGFWLILNDLKFDIGRSEGKAHGYDVLNSAICILQSVDTKQQVWRVLHAFDEKMENQSIYTGMKKINSDLYEFWFDDGFTHAPENKWQISRVK